MKIKVLLVMLLLGTVIMAENLTIGIVYDDIFYENKDQINEILSRELKKNLDTSVDVVVMKEKDILQEQLDELDAQGVDIIYYMGLATRSELANIKTDNNLVVPYYYGDRKNQDLLSISTDYSVGSILDILKEAVAIDKLGIIYDENTEKQASDYKEKISLDKNIQEVKLLDIDTIEEVDLQYDAIINLSLEANERMDFFKYVPTFSLAISRTEGNTSKALFGYMLEEEVLRRLRASSVYLGKGIEDKDILLPPNNLDVVIDYSVARELNVYPGNIIDNLKIINNPNQTEKPTLNIRDGLDVLLRDNTTLNTNNKNLESTGYDIDIAKSSIKPNFDLVSNYSKIDNDRAEANPASAENTVTGGFELTQVLYDPEVFSNINVSEQVYKAEQASLRQDEINEILTYIDTYLNILDSKENLEIQRTSEELSREFLKLAETRNRIGSSSPADIYRFQSEVANSMSGVEDARISLLSSKKELNNLLNRSTSSEFEVSTDSIDMIIDIDKFNTTSLYKPWNIEQLENEFKEKAKLNSPKIDNIDSQIAVVEESYKGTERRRYLPQLVASGSYGEDLKDPWGNGSKTTESDTEWTVGVGFSLPLYTGGEITSQLKGYKADIEALETTKVGIENNISKSVTLQYNVVLSNNKKIELARKSLVASEKGLELQKNLYRNGKITATDLLDSRNSYINARGSYTSTVYEYYSSIAALENLIGSYYFEGNLN